MIETKSNTCLPSWRQFIVAFVITLILFFCLGLWLSTKVGVGSGYCQ